MKRKNNIALLFFSMFIGHFFLPISFILQLRNRYDMLTWILSFNIAACYVTMIFFVGAWSWFSKAALCIAGAAGIDGRYYFSI